MVADFLLGVCVIDAWLYAEHWCGHHGPKWMRHLHVGRHHKYYPTGLEAVTDGGSCMPRAADLDASAATPLVVALVGYLAGAAAFWGALWAGGFAFVMHAAAHRSSALCPSWYLRLHRLHHSRRRGNYFVLFPVWDVIMGTLETSSSVSSV